MAQNHVDPEELLTIRDHINHLRNWTRQQQPILNSLDTDDFLLRFLRITDFRQEKAKAKLIQFWQYRTENSQWFQNRSFINNSSMSRIAQLAYCLQLPKPTKEKHLIFLMRPGKWDPRMFTMDDVTRYSFAVVDIICSQPAAQLYGVIILIDFTNIRLEHLKQLTPDRIRRFVDCGEKLYPLHLRQIHFYNYPTIFHPLLRLFRFIFCRTLVNRIYFHSRTSDDTMKNSLHNYIDPSLLPSEYGGHLDSIESGMNKSFVEWTQQNNDSLIQLEKYGINLQQTSQLLRNLDA